MSDYNQYRAVTGISNNDIIAVLSKVYPNFTKVQCTMINNPEKYGLRLTKEAEKLLAESYGYCPCLDTKPPKKQTVKRIKTKRLAVRLTDEDYAKAKTKMQQMGCKSVQSFLELALENLSVKEN